MRSNLPRPLRIWRLIDGKPGHEKQTAGLVAALARLGEVECRDVPVTFRWKSLFWWIVGHFPPGEGLPDPDLVIGAGHATHLALLAARRAKGGRTVVLMTPSLSLSLFDVCLAPEHDAPPRRDNVIVTRGALNPLVDQKRHQPGRGLILVGGPSSHFAWDSAAVARQVAELVRERPDMVWRLTTSRRTPADFLAGVDSLPGLECLPAAATPPGWLEAQLAEAAEAWCTPDSVSMIYEALTAGCRVGLLELPASAGSRVAAGVAKLKQDGYVTTIRNEPASIRDIAPPAPLNEAARCAQLILNRCFP